MAYMPSMPYIALLSLCNMVKMAWLFLKTHSEKLAKWTKLELITADRDGPWLRAWCHCSNHCLQCEREANIVFEVEI